MSELLVSFITWEISGFLLLRDYTNQSTYIKPRDELKEFVIVKNTTNREGTRNWLNTACKYFWILHYKLHAPIDGDRFQTKFPNVCREDEICFGKQRRADIETIQSWNKSMADSGTYYPFQSAIGSRHIYKYRKPL